jgi:integrase
MRGHVRRRGKKWSVVVDVGTDENGKRRQKWHNGYRTRSDAERAVNELLGRLERGEYVKPGQLTVASYLRDTWVPAIAASVRPSTLTRYQLDVETLSRELGPVALQRLTGAQLDALYARRRGEGASSASVRHLHAVVRRALRDALRNGLVVRNAADAATPPRLARPELATWTAAELRAFLESLSDDRLYAAWLTLASTGVRRGELLALRWRDVDVDAKRLRVERSLVSVRNELAFSEPKTKRGRRSIALDSATAAELRAHRARQSEERLALGLGRKGSTVSCSPIRSASRSNPTRSRSSSSAGRRSSSCLPSGSTICATYTRRCCLAPGRT